jgi:hypothetical protein
VCKYFEIIEYSGVLEVSVVYLIIHFVSHGAGKPILFLIVYASLDAPYANALPTSGPNALVYRPPFVVIVL